FQAEDGIRDFHVTGVQTCALPISFSVPINCSSACALTCNGLLEDAGVHKLPSRTITPAPTTGNACPSSNSNHAAPGIAVWSGPIPNGQARVGSCANFDTSDRSCDLD